MPDAPAITPAPATVDVLWQARSEWQDADKTRVLIQCEALRDCQVRAVRVDFTTPPGPGAMILVCVDTPGGGMRRAQVEQPAAGRAYVRASQGGRITGDSPRVVGWHEMRGPGADYWLWCGNRRGLELLPGEALVVAVEGAPAGCWARATVSGV